MVNYKQHYWASDLPSARASDAFARQVEELSHTHPFSLIHLIYTAPSSLRLKSLKVKMNIQTRLC